MATIEDKDRIFECKNCGQGVQGWGAAHWWFDCGCGSYDPVEVDESFYRERFPWLFEVELELIAGEG
jgi:hypothetical protein